MGIFKKLIQAQKAHNEKVRDKGLQHKTWAFDLNGKHHTIEAKRSGLADPNWDIIVDGVPHEHFPWHFGSARTVRFEVAGVQCVLDMKAKVTHTAMTLYVDGKPVENQNVD
ncbi:MAG: hypothetical protein FJZ95_08555 [Chloroflexi bacterium]|nr:hypothetical protein [Chloroflexota bacterium]